jgi:hypothetical protein
MMHMHAREIVTSWLILSLRGNTVRLVEGARVVAIPAVTLRPHGLHVTITNRATASA